MFSSTIFSRSTVKSQLDILGEEFKPQPIQPSNKKVHKAILYIHKHSTMSKIEKHRACYQYGYQIGYNFGQQQCQGFVKNFIPKPDKKPFISQMKLLYTKIWTSVFDSTAKLYAITTQKAAYKLQDKQFTFTKSICSSNELQVKNFKILIYEFAKGVIQGFLQKYDLTGSVIYSEQANSIYFQIKELTRIQR